MTKLKTGNRVVPKQMTTIEKIVEAIIKEFDKSDLIEGWQNTEFFELALTTAIASVIGQETDCLHGVASCKL